MHKLVIVVVVVTSIFFMSIFVVNERQNAIVTDIYLNQKVYKTGLHFAVPFFSKVDYVFINKTNTFLSCNITNHSSTGQTVQLKLLLDYQVVDAIKYFRKVQQAGNNGGINYFLEQFITSYITDMLNTHSVSWLNRYGIPFTGTITELGINVNNIQLLSIELLDNK